MTANEKLVNIRQELKLTQAELAKIIGVHRGTVSNWEIGKPIPLEKQKHIAKVLGISTARIFDDEIVDDFQSTDISKTIGRIKDLYSQLPADAKLEVLRQIIDTGK